MTRDDGEEMGRAAGMKEAFARRALEMPPFIVMEVLERAQAMEREGRDPGIGGRQDSLYP